jgi:hypothetical protein
MNLALRSIPVYTSQDIFTCSKISRHGTSGFTTPQKEGVLRIFIAFKNPLLLPGLNPRTLVPVASTLTITPPTRRGRTEHDGGGKR